MCGPFPDVVFAKARKRPAKMCGTPEKRRDDPARSKGQFHWISADLIHFLRCSEKNKWCTEEDSNLPGLATASTCSCCVYQFRHLGPGSEAGLSGDRQSVGSGKRGYV